MPPDQDKVWISREEYERLRQTQPAPPQPVVYGQASYAADDPAKVKPIQIAIGAFLAIGLFLSLTMAFFKIVAIPILLVMLIFAAMSLNDFRRAKRQAGQPPDAAGAASQQNKTGKYKVLMIVLLTILAAPVLLIAGLIILFLLFTAGDGGQSS